MKIIEFIKSQILNWGVGITYVFAIAAMISAYGAVNEVLEGADSHFDPRYDSFENDLGKSYEIALKLVVPITLILWLLTWWMNAKIFNWFYIISLVALIAIFIVFYLLIRPHTSKPEAWLWHLGMLFGTGLIGLSVGYGFGAMKFLKEDGTYKD